MGLLLVLPICCVIIVLPILTFVVLKLLLFACMLLLFGCLFRLFALWVAGLFSLHFEVSLLVCFDVRLDMCILLIVLAFNIYFLMLSFVICLFDSCCVSDCYCRLLRMVFVCGR